MVTGVLGAGQVFPAASPFETETMMFAMVWPLPRTSISAGTGPECFLAHTGSASMVIGLRVGAVPENVTIPVMDEPTTAPPGPTDTAINAAASHKLFPVQRMLNSLVIAYLSPPSSPLTLPSA